MCAGAKRKVSKKGKKKKKEKSEVQMRGGARVMNGQGGVFDERRGAG